MKFIICIIFCFCSITTYTQQLSQEAKSSRELADAIIEVLLNKEVKDCNHVIFSVSNENFIVIIEEDKSYKEFFIKNTTDKKCMVIKDTVYKKPNRLFNKMFNKDIYKSGFITFNSDFYKSGYEISSGNITYFVFKDRQENRYGEARLSVFVKPNPIDAEVYLFFVQQLLLNF